MSTNPRGGEQEDPAEDCEEPNELDSKLETENPVFKPNEIVQNVCPTVR